MLDGILVQSGQIGDQLSNRLVNSNMPLVIVGPPLRTDGVSYIDVDNVPAAYNATSHLIRMGYQRVATITGSANSIVGLNRKKGYLKALVERGREVDESLIAEGDFTEAGGFHAMQYLLPAHPDAVFVASDTMALGALRALREADKRVPDQVAIVGFDDMPQAATADPPLTTVRQPIQRTGALAVEMLVDILQNGGSPPRRFILPTELVIRASCGSRLPHSSSGPSVKVITGRTWVASASRTSACWNWLSARDARQRLTRVSFKIASSSERMRI